MNFAKTFVLALIFIASNTYAQTRPQWITNGPTETATSYLVVCSGYSLDPASAQDSSESNCMASAAKLGGVTLSMTSTTIDSTTGVDSSQAVRMVPITSNVECKWKNRFLETEGQGFRLWLLCSVDKKSVAKQNSTMPPTAPLKLPKSGKAMVTVACYPPAEVIIVSGLNGERVFNPLSNTPLIELRHGDERITVRHFGYRDLTKEIPPFENASIFTLTFHPHLQD